MERKFKLSEKQKDIILALHKSELTSRQIAEVAQCAQSTVIRHLQKFQATGQLPMTERRKASRYRQYTTATSSSSTIALGKPFTVNYFGDENCDGISNESMKKPINEQLNYYQNPAARLSYTNMMEVKHSPSSQMDFRTTTNGLPNEEEDEEMDTLLVDSGAVKSIPTSSCDSTPIIQNGTKYPPLEDGMEIDLLDDDMDDELNNTASISENKKENEETEAEKEKPEDLDLFELDLEQAVEKKVTNGETTDSSNVRDTGDDLDTLLSKINDLVEDCMEPSTKVEVKVEVNKVKVNKELVEVINDDKAEDIVDSEAKEPLDDILDETQVVADEEIIESTVEKEVEEKNDDVETSSDVREEEEIAELETEEDAGDEVSEVVKFTDDLSENVSEEAGVEVTATDLELAEEEEVPEEEAPEEEAPEEEVPEEEAPEEEAPEEMQEEVSEEVEFIPEVAEVPEEVVTEIADEEITETVEETAAGIDKEIEEEIAEQPVSDTMEAIEPEAEKISEKIVTDTMDIDDDIVCLDSPMPEEKEDDDVLISEQSNEQALLPLLPQEEEVKRTVAETKEIPGEKEVLEEVSSNEVIPDEIVAKNGDKSLKALEEEDDDIFLIEDDDEPMKEAEPVKEAESTDKPDAKSSEEIELSSKEEDKLLGEEIKDDSKPAIEVVEKEKKTEPISEEKKSESKEDDDDDIVCLDDSFEESEEPTEKKIEEEPTKVISQTVAEKIGDDVDIPVETSNKENVVENEMEEKVAEKEVIEDAEKVVASEVEEIVEAEIKPPDEKVEEPDSSAKNSEEAGKLLENLIKLDEKSEKVAEESLEETIKPTDEVLIESSSKISETETTKPKEIPSAASSNVLMCNDIINLDDDDEDEVATPASTEKKDEQSAVEITENKTSKLLSDNSDNARDGVEEKDDKNEPKASPEKSTPMASEPNSNSSSNLLKESTVTERDESPSEPSEQPPAKRIRLSQDETSSRNSNASREDTSSKLLDDDDVMEVLENAEEENKTLKRVHSSESISSELKKPKTDLESPKIEDDLKTPELLEEIIPAAKVEDVKLEEKPDLKPVEVKPLPLYPPPHFDAPKIGLSLDFLRRFKKSIHKMNKSDLEELVLQKIVEAIVHKSEFSEMRELIEKQEKIISGHRCKITELNKQFRDLEMVHNRVLKDLETKNSQFIMPVKITRAVGLQVFFPNKKYDQPIAALPPSSSMQAPSPSSISRSVSSGSSSSSIPEKAPISNTTSMNNLSSQPSLATSPGGNSNQLRRGCIQKLTPMRPDGPRMGAIPNRGVTAGVVSSSTPSPMTPKDTSPKILNRQLAPKPRLPMVTNIPQQTHNTHSTAIQQEPERPKAPMMPQGIATKKTGGILKTFPPSKRIPKSWQSEQQAPVQSSPTTTPTASSTMVPPISPLSNPPVATKPPNKSVIDLTDEDDVAPAPSAKTPNVSAGAQKPVNNAAGHRVGPYKVSVIPAAQLQQQPRPNIQKPTPPRPQNAPQLGPKPNGTAQNAVRRTPPPPSSQRYRHPAPLPNQPIHSSNPLWKLPPARPTIRISNLDSGIVISWTIEDTAKEKYAESTSYQIYAYQETSGPPLVESWRHVGDVKAMLLPMAVTLTQFQEGQRYYFAVRAVDSHNRCGPFSFAKTWS